MPGCGGVRHKLGVTNHKLNLLLSLAHSMHVRNYLPTFTIIFNQMYIIGKYTKNMEAMGWIPSL